MWPFPVEFPVFSPKKPPAMMWNPGKLLGLVVFLLYFWFLWYNLHPGPKPCGKNAGKCGVFHPNCPFSPKKPSSNTTESRKTLVLPSTVSTFCPQIPLTGTGRRKMHFLHDFPLFFFHQNFLSPAGPSLPPEWDGHNSRSLCPCWFFPLVSHGNRLQSKKIPCVESWILEAKG